MQKTKNKYVLIKDNKPFYIKGAGGYERLEDLKKAGGNTIRTWSCEKADSILTLAEHHNLSVILGLFLFSERHGFDYNDEAAVEKQFEETKRLVLKYKDHPALLMWGVGNEMDIFSAERTARNLKVWNAVNDICKMIHQVDPNHPVTTMIVPFRKTLWNIRTRCPDLDILSINSFGELTKLSSKLKEPFWGWDGPYIVSEWGTQGWWEVERTIWNAPIEATSTKKAEFYRKNYQNIVKDSLYCLGSCVFFWGQKQEKTSSWFSMFTNEGRPTEPVHIMRQLWKQEKLTDHFPKIDYILVNQKGAADDIFLKAGEKYEAEIFFKESQDNISITWEIVPDYLQEKGGGDNEMIPLPIQGLISTHKKKIYFRSPEKEGAYRIYTYLTGSKGETAIANTPFFIIE